jgi:hypothetical protein
MDDLDLQAALGGDMPSDAAESDAATELMDVLNGDAVLEDAALADQVSPDQDADEVDRLDAQVEEEESEEDIRAELDRLKQEKREAEAQAEEARSQQVWAKQYSDADTKLQQGTEWFVEAFDRAYDKEEFLRHNLPRIAAGYAQDIAAIEKKKTDAAMALARKHGTTGWVNHLERAYGLSDGELARVKQFPPEQMEQAAQLIVETRSPIKRELTTTKSQLTKAQKQLGKNQRSSSVRGEPGIGRSSIVSLADVRNKITGDEKELGPILQLMGMTG